MAIPSRPVAGPISPRMSSASASDGRTSGKAEATTRPGIRRVSAVPGPFHARVRQAEVVPRSRFPSSARLQSPRERAAGVCRPPPDRRPVRKGWDAPGPTARGRHRVRGWRVRPSFRRRGSRCVPAAGSGFARPGRRPPRRSRSGNDRGETVAVADRPEGPFRPLRFGRPNPGIWPGNTPPELKDPARIEAARREAPGLPCCRGSRIPEISILNSRADVTMSAY